MYPCIHTFAVDFSAVDFFTMSCTFHDLDSLFNWLSLESELNVDAYPLIRMH